AGNVIAIKDENGNRTVFDYDALNRPLHITLPDPDGAGLLQSPVTSFTYDADGRLLTETDPRGNITHYEYDARGRRTSIIDAAQGESDYTYDGNGNLLSERDSLGHVTSYRYDARNR